MDSRFIVDVYWRVGKFHHNPVQLHQDSLDGDFPVYLLPLDMDVETLIGGLTLRREEVVAGGGQVEEISIKSLVMEISPCAAELVVVRRSRFCSEEEDGAIITQKFNLLISFLNP